MITGNLERGQRAWEAFLNLHTNDKNGNRLTLANPTGTNSYAYDALNRLTTLASPAGTTSYAYDAWGTIIQQTGTVETPYTYTGREFDAETGLYYYRSRYYDPTIGRFLQKDPIGFVGGINVYIYVMQRPTSLIDPLGFLEFSLGVGGALGIFDVNWNSANPLKTTVNLVTPQLGGGFNFCGASEDPSQPVTVEKPSIELSCSPSTTEDRSKQLGAEQPLQELPFTYSVGNKYLGFSFTDDFKSFCLNLGLATGPLPVNVSIPLFSF